MAFPWDITAEKVYSPAGSFDASRSAVIPAILKLGSLKWVTTSGRSARFALAKATTVPAALTSCILTVSGVVFLMVSTIQPASFTVPGLAAHGPPLFSLTASRTQPVDMVTDSGPLSSKMPHPERADKPSMGNILKFNMWVPNLMVRKKFARTYAQLLVPIAHFFLKNMTG